MSTRIACEAHSVSHTYRGVPALTKVSFQLVTGRVIGLVGANGSGKSTLLRILAGVQHPSSGRVTQFGQDISSGDAQSGGIGAAVDGMNVWPSWTAHRTLTYIARLARVDLSHVRPAMRDTSIEEVSAKRVRDLSLGNRQRVSLAIALLTGTKMVLLDEPMNGLDPAARQSTRDLILRLAAEGRTIVLSSHDLNDVESLASDLIVLRQGTVAYTGPTSEFRATTTMTVLSIEGDGAVAHGMLAQAALHCRRESTGKLVVYSHDAAAAIALLGATFPVRVLGERPASLEERFDGSY